MAPLRVAILGTGLSLQVFHWPLVSALPEQFVLHSVLERSGKGRAKEICGEDIKVVKSIDEVVGDDEVDVVVVSTPNNTHYDFAKAALEAGKHVMIEKPVTPTVEEAEELAALATSKNLVLCVYQNRRWDADFLTLKDLLQSGKLGPVHELHSRFDRYRPLAPGQTLRGWKETPGQHNESIYNLGSHIIDQAVTLFGVPDKVACRSFDERGIGLEEAFEMTLLYPAQPGGTTPLAVHLGATMLSSVPEQVRFIAKGLHGSWTKHGLDPQEAFLRTGKRVVDAGYGVEDEEAWGVLDVCEDGKWRRERTPSQKGWYPSIYTSLHDAITSNDPARLAVQPEQAIWTMRLIELGLQSSREGRVIDVEK